ncbi:hypothetical protein jhhlp_001676 [Lomentospora prolificans]|uniref:Glycosyl transferase family 25 domain-containing protein n=1 Tax=Lomentospora prolificans TaxID=41688 RepID=A0A2N3NGY6_9PEZI|nr:hypothetical protein jhhlp_001676 [Lomentospora prolificans]
MSYRRRFSALLVLIFTFLLYLQVARRNARTNHGSTEVFNQTLGVSRSRVRTLALPRPSLGSGSLHCFPAYFRANVSAKKQNKWIFTLIIIISGKPQFQEIFVVNLPERTDRRDAMALMAAATGLELTFADGVRGANVLEKALPPGQRNKNIQSMGAIGSWRAHMNVLQRLRCPVQENITTALILEDDLDWDVRIKNQFQKFAAASQKFTQPLRHDTRKRLPDQYRPNPEVLGQEPLALSIDDAPLTILPRISPYGDDWDVLWLGHTGGELPSDYATLKYNSNLPPSSLLTLLIPDEDTVPVPRHLKRHPWAKKTEKFASLYPPHTRVVHEPRGNGGVQAYAVSQRGARRLLHQFGIEGLTDLWDISLRDFCEGVFIGKEEEKPICATTNPPMMVQYWGGGDSDIGNIGGGYFRKKGSIMVRYSARLNLKKLLARPSSMAMDDVSGLVDQWPDDGAGPW